MLFGCLNNKNTYFQDAWLSHPAYSKWVCKAVINIKAKCKLCHSDIALSNMGINALKSHSEKSVHHKELVTQKKLQENVQVEVKPAMFFKLY